MSKNAYFTLPSSELMNTESHNIHIFNILLKINIPYFRTDWGLELTSCKGPMWEVSMYYNVFGDNNIASSRIFHKSQQNTTPVHHKKQRKQFTVCVNWSHKQPLKTPPEVQGQVLALVRILGQETLLKRTKKIAHHNITSVLSTSSVGSSFSALNRC